MVMEGRRRASIEHEEPQKRRGNGKHGNIKGLKKERLLTERGEQKNPAIC